MGATCRAQHTGGEDRGPCTYLPCHAGVHSWDRRAQTRWTRERIIERLQAWQELTGFGPGVDDWHRPYQDARYVPGEWPSAPSVRKALGITSWADALAIAGVEQPPRWGSRSLIERPCPVCSARFHGTNQTCSASCSGKLANADAVKAHARVVALALEGWSVRAIAAETGRTRAAISNALCRARHDGWPIPRYTDQGHWLRKATA